MQNKEESINLLVDLILFMEAELKESTTQLLVDMKSSLELNPLPQLVVETLQSVFEPSLADLKPKNGAKIRLSTKICKIFKPVLPVSTPTRLKTRTKSLDDFVVIPPSQKVISFISLPLCVIHVFIRFLEKAGIDRSPERSDAFQKTFFDRARNVQRSVSR